MAKANNITMDGEAEEEIEQTVYVEIEHEEPTNGSESTANRKRTREMNEEEAFMLYTDRKKKPRRVINHQEEDEENKIEICITCKDKLPKKIELARCLKEENIENIFKVKYASPYKIFVLFEDESSAEKLITSKLFLEKGWKCHKSQEVAVSYGTIRDIELNVDEKDIRSSISSSTEIVSIKRLFRRCEKAPGWTESESIRIGFKGSSLPPYIFIHGMKVKVERYIFSVTQCSRCFRYGHTLRFCPAKKPTCPKCAGSHSNCETTRFKCVNCGGRHMALLRSCPIYLKEKRIRELMAEFNCTYKRATMVYVPPSPAQTKLNLDEENFPPFMTSNEVFDQPGSDQPRDNAKTYSEAAKLQAETHKFSDTNLLRSQKVGRRNNSQQKKKTRSRDPMDWDMSSESEVQVEEKTQEESQSDRQRSGISVKQLLEKLRNIIFMRRLTLKDKIMQAWEIIRDWAMEWVKELIFELPILQNIFVYG